MSTMIAQTAISGIAQVTNFSMPFEIPRYTRKMFTAKVSIQNTKVSNEPAAMMPLLRLPVKSA
jgi:hypothetical protein